MDCRRGPEQSAETLNVGRGRPGRDGLREDVSSERTRERRRGERRISRRNQAAAGMELAFDLGFQV
jgi:hypothetical protein